jgi:SAM-dependent methyltransferase
VPTGYGRDLAHVHHASFTTLARRLARATSRLLSARGVRGGLVVELGCGTGVSTRVLCDAGFDVLGVDLSAAMLRHARRTAPRARFVRASAFAVAIPPCRAITAFGEVLGYAFDPRSGPGALARLFRRAHAALAPGGVLVFDLIERSGLRPGRTRRARSRGRGWTVDATIAEDRRRRLVVRRIETRRRVGGRWRTSRETQAVRLHDRRAVLRALRAAGFAARASDRVGPVRMLPGRVAFVATSRRSRRSPSRPRRRRRRAGARARRPTRG